MKKKLYVELLIGLGMIALSIWIIYFSMEIEAKAANFPLYISILLLVFGGIFSLQSLIKIFRKARKLDISPEKIYMDKTKIFELLIAELLPYGATILCLLFIWAFPIVGFELSAFCLVFLIMISIKPKVATSTILVSLVVPIILILIFRLGLNIRIPLALDMYFL